MADTESSNPNNNKVSWYRIRGGDHYFRGRRTEGFIYPVDVLAFGVPEYAVVEETPLAQEPTEGAVELDRNGVAWQRRGSVWWSTSTTSSKGVPLTWTELFYRYGPTSPLRPGTRA